MIFKLTLFKNLKFKLIVLQSSFPEAKVPVSVGCPTSTAVDRRATWGGVETYNGAPYRTVPTTSTLRPTATRSQVNTRNQSMIETEIKAVSLGKGTNRTVLMGITNMIHEKKNLLKIQKIV